MRPSTKDNGSDKNTEHMLRSILLYRSLASTIRHTLDYQDTQNATFVNKPHCSVIANQLQLSNGVIKSHFLESNIPHPSKVCPLILASNPAQCTCPQLTKQPTTLSLRTRNVDRCIPKMKEEDTSFQT